VLALDLPDDGSVTGYDFTSPVVIHRVEAKVLGPVLSPLSLRSRMGDVIDKLLALGEESLAEMRDNIGDAGVVSRELARHGAFMKCIGMLAEATREPSSGGGGG
jgi:hypothetical protein